MVEGDLNSVIFHLGIARHLPYIWKSMDVWLICAIIIQPSLHSLTLSSPLHPLTFLPSPLFILLFCVPLPQPHLSLGFIFFVLILTYSAFHLSQPTGQTIPIIMRISLLIKTNQPDQSVKFWIVNTLWKSRFHFQTDRSDHGSATHYWRLEITLSC